MRLDYMHREKSTDEVIYDNFRQLVEFRIGDIRRFADVCSAIKNADIVINAAALKQVPTCEYFPVQAVMTNCMGAYNIVRAIEEHRFPVETVVAISTDKAAKPINVMGMTKAIQERIFISANLLNPDTRFICVRYGNVLASRGSVIPLFHDQITKGGPVTITDSQMTRFLLGLDQAVRIVLTALIEAKPGETYVPDVPSASVLNIAKALIGDRNIEIEATGTRPGEKVHEILVTEEEIHHCVRRNGYFVILPMLPELVDGRDRRMDTLTKEFSSGDNLLDYDGTVELLKHYKLTLDDYVHDPGELLR
jgi:FlaA1/EpsC-like NDP-sugar epimerase